MEILKSLESFAIVVRYEFIDFRRLAEGLFYKLKIEFNDGSFLFARELSTTAIYLYSFHWQDAKNQLIMRWDNAPNHPDMQSHPHHRHTRNRVEESKEIRLEDVLAYIEGAISRNK